MNNIDTLLKKLEVAQAGLLDIVEQIEKAREECEHDLQYEGFDVPHFVALRKCSKCHIIVPDYLMSVQDCAREVAKLGES